MSSGPSPNVTALLTEAHSKPAARDQLLAAVYQQLRQVAQQRLGTERTGHTLQATALVHEAYMRLVGTQDIAWANRAHFFAAAAEAMRRILIDHARTRGRVKRGGGGVNPEGDAPKRRRLALTVVDLAAADDPDEVVAVDEALCRLEKEDPVAASVVRLRFYAGLSIPDTALALGLSERTVAREWSYARAVLTEELGGEEDG
jgi:RNA polymerase sigma factor (TIGR02999 family)